MWQPVCCFSLKFQWGTSDRRTGLLPMLQTFRPSRKNLLLLTFCIRSICQSGKLQIFELASGSLLETVDAHDGALWSLCLAPDQVNMTICMSVCSHTRVFLLFLTLSSSDFNNWLLVLFHFLSVCLSCRGGLWQEVQIRRWSSGTLSW